MSPRPPGYSSPILQPSSTAGGMESVSLPSPTPRPRPSRRVHESTKPGVLTLPSLPRFHPANFPSQGSSPSNTPLSGPNSPQPPVSPRSQQKHYSEAQKQLFSYQREMLSNITSRASRTASKKPVSPRLIPLGSPGPITPLELEGENGGDYLTAGAASLPPVHGMARSFTAEDLAFDGDAPCHGKTLSKKGSRPMSVGQN